MAYVLESRYLFMFVGILFLDDDFAIDEKRSWKPIDAMNNSKDSWRFKNSKWKIKMQIEVQFLVNLTFL